jgi:hypothetical protein
MKRSRRRGPRRLSRRTVWTASWGCERRPVKAKEGEAQFLTDRLRRHAGSAMTPIMADASIISYRRHDTANEADELWADLSSHVQADQVLIDGGNIAFGDAFPESL